MKPSSSLGTSRIWHRQDFYTPYHRAFLVRQAQAVAGLLEDPRIHTKATRL